MGGVILSHTLTIYVSVVKKTVMLTIAVVSGNGFALFGRKMVEDYSAELELHQACLSVKQLRSCKGYVSCDVFL